MPTQRPGTALEMVTTGVGKPLPGRFRAASSSCATGIEHRFYHMGEIPSRIDLTAAKPAAKPAAMSRRWGRRPKPPQVSLLELQTWFPASSHHECQRFLADDPRSRCWLTTGATSGYFLVAALGGPFLATLGGHRRRKPFSNAASIERRTAATGPIAAAHRVPGGRPRGRVLSDRLGHKRLLFASAILFAVTSLGNALALPSRCSSLASSAAWPLVWLRTCRRCTSPRWPRPRCATAGVDQPAHDRYRHLAGAVH